MAGYSYSSRISWPEYLQLSATDRTTEQVQMLRYDIATSSRELIANQEQLAAAGIARLEGGLESTARAQESIALEIAVLSRSLGALDDSISALAGTVEWGFSNLLADTAEIRSALKSLVSLASSPSKTWSYEQFRVARDAFKMGLRDQALAAIERAVNGYQNHLGYELDYRFYYLRGLILLGNFQAPSVEIGDIALAENAFLRAYQLASAAKSRSAGSMILCAGWAAYCQGEIERARAHTHVALIVAPDDPTANFQYAKFSCAGDDREHGIAFLKEAISLCPLLAVKAFSDADMMKYEPEMNRLLIEMREALVVKSKSQMDKMGEMAATILSLKVDGIRLREFCDVTKAESEIARTLEARDCGTYFGALEIEDRCAAAISELAAQQKRFRSHILDQLGQKIRKLDSMAADSANVEIKGHDWVVKAAAVLCTVPATFIAAKVNHHYEVLHDAWRARLLKALVANGKDPTDYTWHAVEEWGRKSMAPEPSKGGYEVIGVWLGIVAVGALAATLFRVIQCNQQLQKRDKMVSDIQAEKEVLEKLRAQRASEWRAS